ncbi:MAG: methyltransferase domain-containing protein [Treponema sp.]|nr:methyltransferase domain-containing protein [Treponema sp.]
MTKGSILIVPNSEPGQGGGHLTRCIKLARDLRSLGRETWLFITPQTRDLTNLYLSLNFNPAWCITNEELTIRNEKLGKTFDFIIMDRFQTPLDELIRWKNIAPVIGVDEGGKHRDKFNFLIDMLIPENFIHPPANIYSPHWLIDKHIIDNITTTQQNLELSELNNNHGVHGGTRRFLYEGSIFSENLQVLQNKDSKFKILISFGQEDKANLGNKIAKKLSTIKSNYPIEITLLKGSLNTNHSTFHIPHSTLSKHSTLKIIESIPNLALHLNEYNLLITHYGITAYEALFTGTPVILAHPTPYHKKLAKTAGFLDIKHLSSLIKRIKNHGELQPKLLGGTRKFWFENLFSSVNLRVLRVLRGKILTYTNLAETCNNLLLTVNRGCPVCGSGTSKTISRYNDRTYHRCFKCGIIYMDRTNLPPIEYEKEYFFESYKNQYGKTYLEDFDNIKESGKKRINIISKILNRGTETRWTRRENKDIESLKLLDIGCAYGPFLAAAKEANYSPFGIDPAEDAIKYVTETLNIPAIHSFFPLLHSTLNIPHSTLNKHSTLNIPHSTLLKNSTLNNNSYNVITLWFVIEHFTDCVSVLNEVKRLLKPGGLLAFSTPSFSGISGRSSIHRFLSKSPADHWTIWSPKSAKKALVITGFKVKKIVIVGHHPERFPVLGKLAKNKKSPVYWLLLIISKIFYLGDTFEVYAELNK